MSSHRCKKHDKSCHESHCDKRCSKRSPTSSERIDKVYIIERPHQMTNGNQVLLAPQQAQQNQTIPNFLQDSMLPGNHIPLVNGATQMAYNPFSVPANMVPGTNLQMPSGDAYRINYLTSVANTTPVNQQIPSFVYGQPVRDSLPYSINSQPYNRGIQTIGIPVRILDEPSKNTDRPQRMENSHNMEKSQNSSTMHRESPKHSYSRKPSSHYNKNSDRRFPYQKNKLTKHKRYHSHRLPYMYYSDRPVSRDSMANSGSDSLESDFGVPYVYDRRFPFERRSPEVYSLHKKRSAPEEEVPLYIPERDDSPRQSQASRGSQPISFSKGPTTSQITPRISESSTNGDIPRIREELHQQNIETQNRIDSLKQKIDELKSCICAQETGGRINEKTTQTAKGSLSVEHIALIPADQFRPCNCTADEHEEVVPRTSRMKSLARSRSTTEVVCCVPGDFEGCSTVVPCPHRKSPTRSSSRHSRLPSDPDDSVTSIYYSQIDKTFFPSFSNRPLQSFVHDNDCDMLDYKTNLNCKICISCGLCFGVDCSHFAKDTICTCHHLNCERFTHRHQNFENICGHSKEFSTLKSKSHLMINPGIPYCQSVKSSPLESFYSKKETGYMTKANHYVDLGIAHLLNDLVRYRGPQLNQHSFMPGLGLTDNKTSSFNEKQTLFECNPLKKLVWGNDWMDSLICEIVGCFRKSLAVQKFRSIPHIPIIMDLCDISKVTSGVGDCTYLRSQQRNCIPVHARNAKSNSFQPEFKFYPAGKVFRGSSKPRCSQKMKGGLVVSDHQSLKMFVCSMPSSHEMMTVPINMDSPFISSESNLSDLSTGNNPYIKESDSLSYINDVTDTGTQSVYYSNQNDTNTSSCEGSVCMDGPSVRNIGSTVLRCPRLRNHTCAHGKLLYAYPAMANPRSHSSVAHLNAPRDYTYHSSDVNSMYIEQREGNEVKRWVCKPLDAEDAYDAEENKTSGIGQTDYVDRRSSVHFVNSAQEEQQQPCENNCILKCEICGKTQEARNAENKFQIICRDCISEVCESEEINPNEDKRTILEEPATEEPTTRVIEERGGDEVSFCSRFVCKDIAHQCSNDNRNQAGNYIWQCEDCKHWNRQGCKNKGTITRDRNENENDEGEFEQKETSYVQSKQSIREDQYGQRVEVSSKEVVRSTQSVRKSIVDDNNYNWQCRKCNKLNRDDEGEQYRDHHEWQCMKCNLTIRHPKSGETNEDSEKRNITFMKCYDCRKRDDGLWLCRDCKETRENEIEDTVQDRQKSRATIGEAIERSYRKESEIPRRSSRQSGSHRKTVFNRDEKGRPSTYETVVVVPQEEPKKQSRKSIFSRRSTRTSRRSTAQSRGKLSSVGELQRKEGSKFSIKRRKSSAPFCDDDSCPHKRQVEAYRYEDYSIPQGFTVAAGGSRKNNVEDNAVRKCDEIVIAECGHSIQSLGARSEFRRNPRQAADQGLGEPRSRNEQPLENINILKYCLRKKMPNKNSTKKWWPLNRERKKVESQHNSEVYRRIIIDKSLKSLNVPRENGNFNTIVMNAAIPNLNPANNHIECFSSDEKGKQFDFQDETPGRERNFGYKSAQKNIKHITKETIQTEYSQSMDFRRVPDLSEWSGRKQDRKPPIASEERCSKFIIPEILQHSKREEVLGAKAKLPSQYKLKKVKLRNQNKSIYVLLKRADKT